MPKDLPDLEALPGARKLVKIIVPPLPTWRDGIYNHSFHSEVKDGVYRVIDRPIRWFPSIGSIGAELLGTAERDSAMQKTGKIIMPPLSRCIEIYLEMLEIVAESKQWHELFTVAGYRMQIGGYEVPEIDMQFLLLARTVTPALSPKEWGRLAERMPPRTTIHCSCFRRSREPLFL